MAGKAEEAVAEGIAERHDRDDEDEEAGSAGGTIQHNPQRIVRP